MMDASFWLNLIIFGCTFIAGSVGLGWWLGNKLSDMTATIRGDYEAHIAVLAEKVKEDYDKNDMKVKRVYERLDKYKDHVENNLLCEFVRKDLCSVMHNTTAQQIQEIKDEIRTRLSSLEGKLDKIIMEKSL